jgi:hypothetical protein
MLLALPLAYGCAAETGPSQPEDPAIVSSEPSPAGDRNGASHASMSTPSSFTHVFDPPPLPSPVPNPWDGDPGAHNVVSPGEPLEQGIRGSSVGQNPGPSADPKHRADKTTEPNENHTE